MNTITSAELRQQEEDWFERFEQLANEEPDREPMHYENYQEEETPTFWCEGCEKRVSMDIFAKGNSCRSCI